MKTRAGKPTTGNDAPFTRSSLGLRAASTTARRTLRDYGGSAEHIIGNSSEFKVLQGWDEMTEFSRGFLYGVLKTRVEHMLEQGFGRRS